jgi:hypothetical protein
MKLVGARALCFEFGLDGDNTVLVSPALQRFKHPTFGGVHDNSSLL